MNAAERIIEKAHEGTLARKQAKATVQTCKCPDCKDPVFHECLCWEHYKEEHYTGK